MIHHTWFLQIILRCILWIFIFYWFNEIRASLIVSTHSSQWEQTMKHRPVCGLPTFKSLLQTAGVWSQTPAEYKSWMKLSSCLWFFKQLRFDCVTCFCPPQFFLVCLSLSHTNVHPGIDLFDQLFEGCMRLTMAPMKSCSTASVYRRKLLFTHRWGGHMHILFRESGKPPCWVLHWEFTGHWKRLATTVRPVQALNCIKVTVLICTLKVNNLCFWSVEEHFERNRRAKSAEGTLNPDHQARAFVLNHGPGGSLLKHSENLNHEVKPLSNTAPIVFQPLTSEQV